MATAKIEIRHKVFMTSKDKEVVKFYPATPLSNHKAELPDYKKAVETAIAEYMKDKGDKGYNVYTVDDLDDPYETVLLIGK